jgi:Tfp pilus assembly protein PilW
MVTAGADRGATAIEMLIAAGISLAVLGSAGAMAGQLQNRYQYETELAQARQEARYALGWITRRLRMAGNNPLSVLVTPCPVAGTPFTAVRIDPDGNGIDDDIRVQSDVAPINGRIGGIAGACDEAGEDVTIALDAATSTITAYDANTDPEPIERSDGIISGLLFAYRDLNHNPTTIAADVAFVEVAITATTRIRDSQRGAPGTFTARAEIRLRSR